MAHTNLSKTMTDGPVCRSSGTSHDAYTTLKRNSFIIVILFYFQYDRFSSITIDRGNKG